MYITNHHNWLLRYYYVHYIYLPCTCHSHIPQFTCQKHVRCRKHNHVLSYMRLVEYKRHGFTHTRAHASNQIRGAAEQQCLGLLQLQHSLHNARSPDQAARERDWCGDSMCTRHRTDENVVQMRKDTNHIPSYIKELRIRIFQTNRNS